MARQKTVASLLAEKAALEDQIRAAKEREAAESQKRHALVGRVLLERAESDADFNGQLLALLNASVTKKGERSLLGLSERHDCKLAGAGY